ncbi:MAG: sensor histidine kinase, partial [Beijerinckiaceae bacterium]
AGDRGVGLGLPLVKALVELHGGVVSVQSKAGTGTTVTCLFPLGAARAPAPDAAGSPSTGKTPAAAKAPAVKPAAASEIRDTA